MEIPGGGGSNVKPSEMENRGGGGSNWKKPSVRGVWIFSGTPQYYSDFFFFFFFLLYSIR